MKLIRVSDRRSTNLIGWFYHSYFDTLMDVFVIALDLVMNLEPNTRYLVGHLQSPRR